MKVLAKNKKIYHLYDEIDNLLVGIVLFGGEVKSIKNNNFNIEGSFATIKNNELFLINMNISPYEKNTTTSYDTTRTRKLLATKQEIKKLLKLTTLNRYTIVPYEVLVDKKGLIKIKLIVAKGKNKRDKREQEKEKDFRKTKNISKWE